MSPEASRKSGEATEIAILPGGDVRLSAPARAAQVLALRTEEHWSFAKIAKIMGFGSPSAAYDSYKSALEWAAVDLDIDTIIKAEVLKLDFYTEKLMEHKYIDARVIEVLTKVAERKAKLLGLDAPEKKLIKGQFDVDTRITEVGTDFVADVIRELGQTNRRALTAHHEKPVDSSQADRETSSVSSRATA